MQSDAAALPGGPVQSVEFCVCAQLIERGGSGRLQYYDSKGLAGAVLVYRSLRLVLVLACGGAISFSVAWLSAWCIPLTEHARLEDLMSFGRTAEANIGGKVWAWQLGLIDTPTGTGVTSFLTTPEYFAPNRLDLRDPPSWSRARTLPTERDVAMLGFARFEDARGWPMRCLKSTYRGDATFQAWTTEAGVEFASGQRWPGIPRALPVQLIWLGYVVDTATYSCIVAVLWYAAIRIQRARRVRRGMCPMCAYPRGISPCCSECGEVFARADTPTPR